MELVERTDAMGEVAAIYNFHRVNDSVWTAGQPLLEHLPKLKEEGIRAVINLREHSEHEGEREAEKVLEAGMHYFNVPVNYRHPTPADADAFLRTTDEQMAEGPVFIHCTAAVRVGAFWLIRRVVRDGWTFEKALEEANAVGLNDDQHLLRFAKEYIEGVTGD